MDYLEPMLVIYIFLRTMPGPIQNMQNVFSAAAAADVRTLNYRK